MLPTIWCIHPCERKKISNAIKRKVLADPTIKPSAVYQREVFAVRDGLSDAEKVENELKYLCMEENGDPCCT